MMVSVATACIPFLENDDCNRALMGSNMQRQAVPLMVTQQPIVATGMEYKAATDSGTAVLAKTTVSLRRWTLTMSRCATLRASWTTILWSSSPAPTQAPASTSAPSSRWARTSRPVRCWPTAPQCATARSLWARTPHRLHDLGGYNYEDAVLLNEKIVREDVYTSIHIEEYETESRDTKLGPEEITRDIPNVSEDALKDLDERGIIRIGAEVKSGDILVGKVTPKARPS